MAQYAGIIKANLNPQENKQKKMFTVYWQLWGQHVMHPSGPDHFLVCISDSFTTITYATLINVFILSFFFQKGAGCNLICCLIFAQLLKNTNVLSCIKTQ